MKKTLFVSSVFFSVISAPSLDPALQKVSKKDSLGRYEPRGITTFMGIKMSRRILPDLKRLLRAAKKDGLDLKPLSGYRSYTYQQNLFKRYVAQERKKNPQLSSVQAETLVNTYSASPGHSEHQLGTTIDLLSAENNYAFSSDPSLAYVGWLEKNAPRFNFKISYPKGGTDYIYEPWHLRWYPSSK